VIVVVIVVVHSLWSDGMLMVMEAGNKFWRQFSLRDRRRIDVRHFVFHDFELLSTVLVCFLTELIATYVVHWFRHEVTNEKTNAETLNIKLIACATAILIFITGCFWLSRSRNCRLR
jgi:hypothetical protein